MILTRELETGLTPMGVGASKLKLREAIEQTRKQSAATVKSNEMKLLAAPVLKSRGRNPDSVACVFNLILLIICY